MSQREVWIETQQIHTFLRHARSTLHAASLLIGIVVVVLYQQAEPIGLWLWTLVAAAVTLLRYRILQYYWRGFADISGSTLGMFMARYAWAWPLSAVVWGSLMFVVYRKVPLHDQLLCVTILVGIAVAAMASSSPCLRSFLGYCNGLCVTILAAMAWELCLEERRKADIASVLNILGEMALVLFLWAGVRVLGRWVYRAQRANLELQFDRLELIESLAEKQRVAREADAVRGRFVASTAHDMRQPVHALNQYADWLLREPEFAAQIARRIADSTRRIDELFESLFNLAGLNPVSLQVRLQPVDLAALVNTLAVQYAPQARERRLRLRTRAIAAWVLSDSALLLRLVSSMLTNALRNTYGGGVLLAVRQHEAICRIELWDTGTGIARERHQNFFQGIPRQGTEEGFGLELATIYRLSQLLGHPVGMTDRRGRGSVFWVEFGQHIQPRATGVLQGPGSR